MTETRNDKKAFTLMELLIAAAIFAVLGMIAVGIFINVAKANRRINLENHIYGEAYILMEKLVREVRKGTIDYEEYHSRQVIWDPNSGTVNDYGANYGEYSKKFYHPGYCSHTSCSDDIDSGFGLLCSDDQTIRYPNDPNNPCTPYQPSQDIRGGMNPYLGFHTDGTEINLTSDPKGADKATAFCDSVHNTALINPSILNKNCDTDGTSGPSANDYQSLHTQEQLYLINGSGDQKTMIARERINDGPNGTPKDTDDEYAVSFIRLSGADIDQDDIRETWTCTQDFVCTADSLTKPDPEDLGCLNFLYDYTNNTPLACSSSTPERLSSENFIPLTPFDINVASLKFLVSPLEDPYKAYEEYSATQDYILMQPYVTIVLTVKPAFEKARSVYPDPANLPEITLQTTVSARVYNEIKSY